VKGPERIAVLGAGGFLGSHLVAALLARPDVEVDAVDVTLDKLGLQPPERERRLRRVRARLDAPGVGGAGLGGASLGGASLIDEVVERCGTVVSMTALCNPSLYNTRPIDVIDANYTDLVPLVKACAARGRRLVHFSTCEVYGRVALEGQGLPSPLMSEARTGFFLGPVAQERWTYACAKQLLERLIWAHGRHEGLGFTIIRPFNVIGPRMDFVPGVDGEGVPRVLASFMAALLRGEPLQLVDGGQQRRSFISVEDFTDAIVRIIERPAACGGEILNVGNPANDVTIRALAAALAEVYAARVPGATRASLVDVTAEAFYGPGYDDTHERLPDVARARQLLDWEPRTTLAEMLPGIVDDYVARYGARLAESPTRAASGRR
jgi:UDP-apiose/xylose synthase